MLPVTLERIIEEMLDLYWMQKVRNDKSENNNDNN